MTATRERLNLRIPSDDRARFDHAAELLDTSLTQFLIESGRERAERVLADRREFVVEDPDWDELVAAMDRPAEARPELVDLFSRARPE